MREERFCRRPGFRPGRTIRLADGQFWTFPVPAEGERIDFLASGSAYEALLKACLEAEDEPDRRRGELALGIALMDANYFLESSDFTSLLEFEPGDPSAVSVQECLTGIAWEHIRAFRKTIVSSKSSQVRNPWDLLVRPWKWFGAHSHLAHSSTVSRRHPSPSSRPRPLAQESRF